MKIISDKKVILTSVTIKLERDEAAFLLIGLQRLRASRHAIGLVSETLVFLGNFCETLDKELYQT